MNFVLPSGKRVHLIGDPHLGKKFEAGVSLLRRGEREAMQMQRFIRELAEPGEIVVVVGDLFDQPYVGYAVVKTAADAVLNAAHERPDTIFYVLAGNHDMPRNITAVGAFDVFKKMVDGRLSNLWTVTVPIIAEGLAMFPWEWGCSARSQVPLEKWSGVDAVIGHWDLQSHGGSDEHLAPTAALKLAFGGCDIYSGHYHVAGDYVVDGTRVHCTGSMEPYAHDQDPDGTLYLTLSREEAIARADELRDKVVRVQLRPGEDLPQLNALAVTADRLPAEVDEGAGPEYREKSLDWSRLMARKLEPLDETVRAFILERIPDHAGGDE